MTQFKHFVLAFTLALVVLASAQGADKKPSILVIFGEDIAMWNVGAYTHDMMGRTGA